MGKLRIHAIMTVMNAHTFGYLAVAMTITVVLGSCGDDDGGTQPTNRPPIANAGANQEVELGTRQVFLNGSASYDPDNDPLTFLWTQTSGPVVVLGDSSAVAPTFSASPTVANLTFELRVSDGRGGTSSDGTIVRVTASPGNAPPTANAGADQTVPVSSLVTLNGSGADPFGGPVSYLWAQYAGAGVTLSSTTDQRPTFMAPDAEAVLSFELTVTDEDGRFTKDSTTVSVDVTPTPSVPTLYVVNSNDTVSGFQNPETRSGDTAPELHLAGAMTQLGRAWDVAADANRALLIANRSSSITVYGARNQNGDVAPDRRVEGGDTGIITPTALAVDRSADILFVADAGQEGVLVYDGVSRNSFDGNVAFSRAFWTQNLEMAVAGASYDDSRDHLYIAESTIRLILVYHSASSANRQVSFARSIQHQPSTEDLTDVWIDSANDRLYATNDRRGEIYVWDNASTVSGGGEEAAPTRTLVIGGSPQAIAVDSSNHGYIADANDTIFAFDDIHTLSGPVTPTRTIRGGSTQLSSPRELFVLE